jgi:excinuclease ABC subunit A
MKPDTVQSVVDTVMRLPEGTRYYVAFPLRLSDKVTHDVVVENLRAQGYVRVAFNGTIHHLDELTGTKIDLTRARELLVIIDRLVLSAESANRLSDAVGTAFSDGEGDCIIIFAEKVTSPLDGEQTDRLRFTE